MTSTTQVTATGNVFVDALLNRTAWASESITFGFTTSSTQYSSIYGQGETSKGYQALSGTQVNAVKEAISSWAELINLKIVETSGTDADIRIAASSAPRTAWAYSPGTSAEAGDVWFGTGSNYYTSPKAGNYAFDTFVHELGHALGLAHPHENKLGVSGAGFTADDGTGQSLCPCCAGLVHGSVSNAEATAIEAAGEALTPAQIAAYYGTSTAGNAYDAMAYSVMSYSSYANDGRGGYTNGTWDYAQSPMLRDIAAVQYLYGANYTTRAGDTVYSWNQNTGEKIIDGIGQGAPGGNKVFETIWDGDGRDTIDLSSYSSNLRIDLAPGGWSNFGNGQLANLGNGHTAPGNVALAYLYQGDERSLIENAVGGSGNDTILGNAANNVLVGGAGNDRIEGFAGHNILAGGSIGTELSLVGLTKSDWISATLPVIVRDGDDTLIGGTDNDIFLPGNGTNTVQGNGGVDTLVLNFALSAIDIVKSGLGLLFTYEGGSVSATGIDYLATTDGVYAFKGTDAVIDLEAANTTQDISLLYSAGLGRDIDPSGLQYWSNLIDQGQSLAYLASGIIASPEFSNNFGASAALDNTSFVNVLYENVLDRQADAAGTAYWVEAMAHGQSRADVLVAFSVSDENRANLPVSLGSDLHPTDGVELVAVTTGQWHQAWL